MFTIASQSTFLKTRKKNILSNCTVKKKKKKKVSFSYNRETTTKNNNIWKSLTDSLYVAYVQESPETANPSIIVTAPLLSAFHHLKLFSHFPCTPMKNQVQSPSPMFSVKVVIIFFFFFFLSTKMSKMYAHEQLCYPKFFLVMVTQAALWAMIVTDRFCATRKKKKRWNSGRRAQEPVSLTFANSPLHCQQKALTSNPAGGI